MNSDITFKNFRVFDEKGETFKIRPITILTGKNSCGKSSVVKGIELLCDSLYNPNPSKSSSDITLPFNDMSHMDLNFQKYPANMMGTFDNVIHKFPNVNKDTIIFEYTVDIPFHDNCVRTELEYSSGNSNNGKLNKISMYYGASNTPFLIKDRKGVNSSFDNIQYNDILNSIWNTDVKDLKKSDLFNFMPFSFSYFEKNKSKFAFMESGVDFSTLIFDGGYQLLNFDNKVDFVNKYSDKLNKTDRSDIMFVFDDFKKSEYIKFTDYLLFHLKKSLLNAFSYQIDKINNNSIEEFEDFVYFLQHSQYSSIVVSKLGYELSSKIEIKAILRFVKFVEESIETDYLNVVVDFMKTLFKFLINNSIKPDFINCSFMNSWPTIKRLYSFDDKDFASSLLNDYYKLYGNERQDNKTKFSAHKFISSWLQNFEIAKDFKLEFDGEGLGVKVYLVKNNEKEPTLLADEGSGITQLFFLLLLIVVGKEKNTILVEEPEIHFHPAFQSKLAELFVEAHNNKFLKADFIIETHSAYLVRKMQNLVIDKSSKLSSDDIIMYYIERGKDKKITKRNITIDSLSGNLSDDFGEGFLDEEDRLYDERIDIYSKTVNNLS